MGDFPDDAHDGTLQQTRRVVTFPVYLVEVTCEKVIPSFEKEEEVAGIFECGEESVYASPPDAFDDTVPEPEPSEDH